MAFLLSFRNVSLFEKEEFGISRLNLEIQLRKKYHIILETEDKLNTLLGLFEGRYRKDGGMIYRKERLFVQSDRLLLGDKVYSRQVDNWLALDDEFFYFGNKRCSKSHFIDLLQAKHIKHFPVYKLKGEDKIKFALLALTFQETGLICISKLVIKPLANTWRDYVNRLIKDTHCTLCIFSSLENISSDFLRALDHVSLEKNDLTNKPI